jgi:hypothetical protein
MFMTPGPLPLEGLWVDFLAGHEGLYSVYVHASEGSETEAFGWRSEIFKKGAIPSRKVFWGRIEMVDAERRLLAHALMDPANMFFVLLSDSCIPLFDFNYVYAFLMGADKSYVESFNDPGMCTYLSSSARTHQRTFADKIQNHDVNVPQSAKSNCNYLYGLNEQICNLLY